MLLLGLFIDVNTETGIEGNNVKILTAMSANKGPKRSLEKENILNIIPANITTMNNKVLITGFILILSKELKENIIAIPIINTSSIWIVTIPIQPSQLSTIISMMTNKNWIIALNSQDYIPKEYNNPDFQQNSIPQDPNNPYYRPQDTPYNSNQSQQINPAQPNTTDQPTPYCPKCVLLVMAIIGPVLLEFWSSSEDLGTISILVFG